MRGGVGWGRARRTGARRGGEARRARARRDDDARHGGSARLGSARSSEAAGRGAAEWEHAPPSYPGAESAEAEASRLPRRRRLHAEAEDVRRAAYLPSSRLDRRRRCRWAEEPPASEARGVTRGSQKDDTIIY